MKRIALFLLAVLMLMSFTGCTALEQAMESIDPARLQALLAGE